MGCVYLPITKVDIENDDSAPDAIENIIEDGNVHITASKPGHAKVTFHYTPLDGYEDGNNGSISFYLTAMEEKIISSVEVITPVSDSINCAVLPGEEISLKADVKSYITSAEGKEYEQNTERPLKYEWTLTFEMRRFMFPIINSIAAVSVFLFMSVRTEMEFISIFTTS